MTNLWDRFIPGVAKTKRNMFLAILLLIALISVTSSLLAKYAFLDRPEGEPLRVALLAPLNGPDEATGRAMVHGLQLSLEAINSRGGIQDRPVEALIIDETKTSNAELRKRIGGDDDLVAVIGPWSPQRLALVQEVTQVRQIPVIVPSSVHREQISQAENLYATVFDQVQQTRFLANYNRNVVGEKTVSVIHADDAHGKDLFDRFDKTYRRFGTKVLNTWTYTSGDPDLMKKARVIARQFKAKKLTGSIFLQGGSADVAPLLVALRDANVRNPVIGLSELATNAFVVDVAKHAADDRTANDYLNGLMVTTPLLFDTATELAQAFRSRYVEEYGTVPDWPAAYSYDAGSLVAEAMLDVMRSVDRLPDEQQQMAVNGPALRLAVSEHLIALNRSEAAQDGAAGSIYFKKGGITAMPVQMGLYNGSSMISALTQLQPITEGGVTGYLDLLRQGKVLYVNDGFMYRTNVVYAGVQLKDVDELDATANTVKLNFLLWFRYRGDFSPENIVFENAVDAIELGDPVREGKDGDMLYKAYQVDGTFNLNFSRVERAYGNELVGLSFHHQLLSKNNLMYVTDVIGMGLASNQSLLDVLRDDEVGQDVGEQLDSSELGRLKELANAFGGGETGNSLLDHLVERRVLAPLAGWQAVHAWISQELLHGSSEGDPGYVGYGKPRPDFSQINFGMVLKPERIEARDFIPANWFVYVVISSLVASFFAFLMDRRDRGQFWRMQTLVIRAVAWPLLLLAGGALLLDYAVSNMEEATVDMIVVVYESLWWLVPARIFAIALERFVWVPLEIRTARKIPNVVRIFGSGTIYLFAVFGIIAFVFDQRLTSLLATSGLLAMIIGLAIQANIANVFSGIVLNIERPFKVGDWIAVKGMEEGVIMDITWRTIRVKTRNGFVTSMPNAQVSETLVNNYSAYDKVRVTDDVYLDPGYDPDRVIAVMQEAIRASADMFAKNDKGEPWVDVKFFGTEVSGGMTHAHYWIAYWLKDYADLVPATDTVNRNMHKGLREAGIPVKVLSNRVLLENAAG